MNISISLGGDHAGFAYKKSIFQMLTAAGYRCIDRGPYSDESCDYPDFSHPVAEDVESGRAQFGILICGSGNGVAMTANKHQGVRAGLAWDEELAQLTRAHNDANVLALPARFISEEKAKQIVMSFLNTPFEGGRHQRRVDKIAWSGK